jgi:hypothetical protein
MKKVMVTRDDAWKLDTSMFCVEGSWETGYVHDADIFFMAGVGTYYEEGASSLINSLEAELGKTIFHLQAVGQSSWWLQQAANWVEAIRFDVVVMGDHTTTLEYSNHVMRCLGCHYKGMQ